MRSNARIWLGLGLLCAAALGSPTAQAKWVWDPDTGLTDTSAYETGDPKQLFDAASALYDARKFKDAADEFRKIAKYCPDPVYQEKCQYLWAESLYSGGAYYQAYEAYEQYLEYYPQTDRLKDIVRRQFDIGLKLIQGAKKELFGMPILSGHATGVDLIHRVLAKYPYEEYSDEYHFLLANHFYEREEYEEAALEYEQFLKTYPSSEWTPTAQFQLAQCHLHEHSGLEYDPQPMDKARAALEKYVEQNPKGDKVKEAGELLAKLNDTSARKDFETALFYVKKGKPKSALVYLRGVVAGHPGSPWATKAQEMIHRLDPSAACEPPPAPAATEPAASDTGAVPATDGSTSAPSPEADAPPNPAPVEKQP